MVLLNGSFSIILQIGIARTSKKKGQQVIEKMRTILLLLLVLINVGCDQVSKRIVREKIDYYEEIKIVDRYFVLTKVENSGAFLSLGNNLPGIVKIIFLSILPALILLFGLYYLIQQDKNSAWLSVGIAFALGGGIGNLYDRILYGSVTDFMHIDYLFIKTGIFNMADVSIMTGMILIIIGFWAQRKNELTLSEIEQNTKHNT
ncbi:signal peptidase II [Olivibacter jilunii]|uniref:Lipoprotein signal peptidase n=2 Tax=Sphingobacteriaceae TaxID=84566 RepID=F4CDN8_SPHS2